MITHQLTNQSKDVGKWKLAPSPSTVYATIVSAVLLCTEMSVSCFQASAGGPWQTEPPPPLPAKPGHCRQGPPMSNKKGPLLPLRQREDETDASVFLSLHLSPDAHRRKKKKEREEGKQSVAFWGVPPPTPFYPGGVVLRRREGAWAM